METRVVSKDGKELLKEARELLKTDNASLYLLIGSFSKSDESVDGFGGLVVAPKHIDKTRFIIAFSRLMHEFKNVADKISEQIGIPVESLMKTASGLLDNLEEQHNPIKGFPLFMPEIESPAKLS